MIFWDILGYFSKGGFTDVHIYVIMVLGELDAAINRRDDL